jgi:hypothetical protein
MPHCETSRFPAWIFLPSVLDATTSVTTMDLHLTDEQAELLLAALDRLIENDRYPLSPRVKALR